MKNLFEDIWKIAPVKKVVPVKLKPRRALSERPWLVNAIIGSLDAGPAPRSRRGDQWQIVQAPAFIRIFRRVRNDRNRSWDGQHHG